MSVEKDLAYYLAANGYGSIGGNIFYGFMPETSLNVFAVFGTGGPDPDESYDEGLVLRYPSVQVMVHHENYDTGKTRCDNIISLLSGKSNVTMNGTVYKLISASGDIIPLGKVEVEGGKTNEFSLNFRTIKDA